ncbi:hypothetical protein ACFVWX_21095 [Streptomyces sp. NPDC058220]|uniref:hypothetical protein n=1 Tax=unclassified Streptomyces TaxID=2593676 RepID=UPI003652E5F6
MSFEEEWAAVRADAVKQQDTRMQLNSHPAGDGPRGGGKKLHVTSSELQGRADKADTVRSDFTDADNATMKETEQVGASLKGFKSGPAFTVFQARWRKQMSYVEGLLTKDVAGALRASAVDFEVREKAEADRHKGKGQGKGEDKADDGRHLK